MCCTLLTRYISAITEFNKHDMDNFFTWGLDTDNRDSTRKSFSVEQGGMTLPDNTYYLEDSDVMRVIFFKSQFNSQFHIVH